MPEPMLLIEAPVALPADAPEGALDAEVVFASAGDQDLEEGRRLGDVIDTEDDTDTGGI